MGELQIHINLLKRDNKQFKFLTELVPFLILTVLLGAGMFYAYFIKADQLVFEQSLNRKLQNQLEKRASIQQTLSASNGLEKQLSERKGMVRQYANQGIPVTQILSAVENTLPAGVVATSIEINGDKVLISGYSPQHFLIAQLIAGLIDDPRFIQVSLVSSRYDTDSGQIMFSVDMKWGRK